MDKRVRDILHKEIRAVRQSMAKVIVGLILIGLCLLFINTILLAIPLILIVWSEVLTYRIERAVLMLSRYFIDKDYAKKIDEQNKKE